jgi:hypothetical protein
MVKSGFDEQKRDQALVGGNIAMDMDAQVSTVIHCSASREDLRKRVRYPGGVRGPVRETGPAYLRGASARVNHSVGGSTKNVTKADPHRIQSTAASSFPPANIGIRLVAKWMKMDANKP